MVVHTAEKKQIKYFAQNQLGKTHSSMCKLLLDFLVAPIIYVYSSLWSLAKDFPPFRELQGLEMYYTMNDHHTRKNHLECITL